MKTKILKKIKFYQQTESKKFQDEIQKLTDKFISNIDELSKQKEAEILKVQILPNNINHVSFIMDGNNRWSIKNNISILNSYSKGS